MPDEEDIEASMRDDEINFLRGLVIRLRGGIQEIYAIRGEDEDVAQICDPLIEASRDF